MNDASNKSEENTYEAQGALIATLIVNAVFLALCAVCTIMASVYIFCNRTAS